jgi:IMP dehydrogenase
MRGLTFADVLLIPSYNSHASRRDVDISMQDKTSKLKLRLPIFTANMDTVTEDGMANFISSKGGVSVLHRFLDVDQNVKIYKKCQNKETFISVGCSEKEMSSV